jgi:hypothetical protein
MDIRMTTTTPTLAGKASGIAKSASGQRGTGGTLGGPPVSDDIGPISYPAEAILTTEQVARWMQVSVRTVKDWPLPRLRLPGSLVRFSAGEVLAYLEGRKSA